MHGRAQQGRSRQSYLSMLLKEVRTYSKKELRTLMRDRDKWRGYLAKIGLSSDIEVVIVVEMNHIFDEHIVFLVIYYNTWLFQVMKEFHGLISQAGQIVQPTVEEAQDPDIGRVIIKKHRLYWIHHWVGHIVRGIAPNPRTATQTNAQVSVTKQFRTRFQFRNTFYKHFFCKYIYIYMWPNILIFQG